MWQLAQAISLIYLSISQWKYLLFSYRLSSRLRFYNIPADVLQLLPPFPRNLSWFLKSFNDFSIHQVILTDFINMVKSRGCVYLCQSWKVDFVFFFFFFFARLVVRLSCANVCTVRGVNDRARQCRAFATYFEDLAVPKTHHDWPGLPRQLYLM